MVTLRDSATDLEIVGQPVSLADRKFLTLQKVLMASSLRFKFLLRWFVTYEVRSQQYNLNVDAIKAYTRDSYKLFAK